MCAAHGTQWELFLENLENKFFKSCENKKNRVGDGVEGEQKLKK